MYAETAPVHELEEHGTKWEEYPILLANEDKKEGLDKRVKNKGSRRLCTVFKIPCLIIYFSINVNT